MCSAPPGLQPDEVNPRCIVFDMTEGDGDADDEVSLQDAVLSAALVEPWDGCYCSTVSDLIVASWNKPAWMPDCADWDVLSVLGGLSNTSANLGEEDLFFLKRIYFP